MLMFLYGTNTIDDFDDSHEEEVMVTAECSPSSFESSNDITSWVIIVATIWEAWWKEIPPWWSVEWTSIMMFVLLGSLTRFPQQKEGNSTKKLGSLLAATRFPQVDWPSKRRSPGIREYTSSGRRSSCLCTRRRAPFSSGTLGMAASLFRACPPRREPSSSYIGPPWPSLLLYSLTPGT